MIGHGTWDELGIEDFVQNCEGKIGVFFLSCMVVFQNRCRILDRRNSLVKLADRKRTFHKS